MTELSIIVPMHNAERFIPTCLESIRRSYEPGFQFILIDDCSTDRTPELLADAQHDNPALTVLRNEVNIGVAASRNRALGAVEGRYLTYYDADDWCAPGHFRELLDSIKTLKVDSVRTGHVRVTGWDRRIVAVPGQSAGIRLPADVSLGQAGRQSPVDYPFLWAGIYDTTQLNREWLLFNENLRTAADRPWFWRLYMESATTATTSQATYFYRKTANTTALTQAGNPSTLHFTDAYDDIRDLVVPTGNDAWIDKAAYAACRIVCFHIESRERLSDALQRTLVTRAAALLKSFPLENVQRGARSLPLGRRLLIQRLLRSQEVAA